MIDRPDFLIIGGRVEGKVYLMASKTLREAVIREDYEYGDIWSGGPFGHEWRIRVEAWMNTYDMVMADSYPEAWTALFTMWSPPGQPELPGQKALP